jgi:serine protease Do
MRTAILGTLLVWSAAAQSPTRPAKILADYSTAMEDLARSASPAVVQILVQRLAPLGKADSQRAGFVTEQDSTGSGVIVDPEGYIVTNAHVVQSARRIEVRIMQSDAKGQEPHGHTLSGKLVGLDREVDIAVVKVEGHGLPALTFVNSDNLKQGQLVLALGSPLALENSLTHGVVSATYRQLKPESPMVYIQTDAPINPGNSGGPLLDIEGRIAGINTMIYSESGGSEGIGFAIPSNLAMDVYQRLRKDGHVHRGSIGVLTDTITPTLGAALGLNRDSGVILSDVEERSAAEAAGLEPGDIILSVDGKPMRAQRDMALAIFQRSPGDQVTMEILRGQERMTKKVAVVERTNEPEMLEDLANTDAALVRRLGILAVTVDARVTRILPNLRRLYGVAVAAIPAEYAGLNPGLVSLDVIYALNNQKIASVDELRAALSMRKPGDPLAFLVERFGQLIYVTGNME